jgi:hypothetical protein
MQNLDFKVGFGRKKNPRYMRHHTWVAVAIGGSAVLGAGVTMIGANKQSKAIKDAQNTNAELQGQQNNSAWQAYLMSRGLDPMGATAGNMPGGVRAINAKLPLWATVNMKVPGAKPTWRKKGSNAPANTLARLPAVAAEPTSVWAEPAMAGGGGSSRTNDLLIGNPLGIGGKDRSFFDPLGIF